MQRALLACCQSLFDVQERYHHGSVINRRSQATGACRDTQCRVYQEFKRATFCARLLAQLSENGASYAADYAHQMLNNPKDQPLRSFCLDYPSFGQV